MNSSEDSTSLVTHIQWYFIVSVIVWTLIVTSLLLYGVFKVKRHVREIIKGEAIIHFNKDLSARLWASSHGGVYVPVTKETPPNPYLSHIPDRDVKTPSGKSLTLMNPAYMIRQMMEYYKDLYGVKGHITSLKPLREETAPDEWEKTALTSFESGVKEVSEFTESGNVPFFRLMQPLIAKEQCLKCHNVQGYKAGDILGGVSVSVPIDDYLTIQKKEIFYYIISFSILWILGLTVSGLAFRRLKVHVRDNEKADYLLTQSREKFSTLVESSLIGIYITQDGVIKFANSRAAETYGYSKDEFVGMDSLAIVHPEEQEMVREFREKRLMGETAPLEYETRGIKKNGETIWVLHRNARYEFNGKAAVLKNILDITELKRTQNALEVYAKELERSNRELDQFAAIASHDMSEPLRKINVFGNLLKDKYNRELDERGKDYLDRMCNASERMRGIIDALRDYSKITSKAQPFTQISLADSVNGAISNLEIIIQRTGGKIYVEDLPELEGEPSQLTQLFQNLIGNSLKYHRKEEPPVIHIRAQMVNSTKVRLGDKSVPAWEIHVEDNGIGFEANQAERIFFPFERLHSNDAYPGAGIGLAVCYKIVERHGGTIRAVSTPGKGSNFIIILPAKQIPFKPVRTDSLCS